MRNRSFMKLLLSCLVVVAVAGCGGLDNEYELHDALPSVPVTPAWVWPTPTSEPTPEGGAETVVSLSADHRVDAGRRHMLKLINEERARVGVEALTLGGNVAAQVHAEIARDACVAAHWDLNGLKPYMRYSLLGGYQRNDENIYGVDYCVEESGRHPVRTDSEVVLGAMKGWMASTGHRKNVLDPHYKKVNIGIAWGGYNTVLVQHFETDYVRYDLVPDIVDGVLFFSGNTVNGIQFKDSRALAVMVNYDPPPRPLTRGQLARSYCYGDGHVVAALRAPVPAALQQRYEEATTTYIGCPDPYDVPPEAAAPGSSVEAVWALDQAINAYRFREPRSLTVPWIVATEWVASGQRFAVSANIEELLARHGDGVYSVRLWAMTAGGPVSFSHHSIFHGVTPPEGYGPVSRAGPVSGMGDSA